MLFNPGDKVYHVSKKRWVKIKRFIGGTERRYEVEWLFQSWSVPESFLTLEKPFSK